MVIRITNKCMMGCNHCMINAGPDGGHMSSETFDKTLNFIDYIGAKTILITGGEPTEHPQFFDLINRAKKRNNCVTIVLSNGMFLESEEFRNKAIDLQVPFQITNDERYYPKRIKTFEHSLFAYEDHIRHISPFGRAVTNKLESNRMSPVCFNLKSLTKHLKSFRGAVRYLEQNTHKFCIPSINIDGTVAAGESTACNIAGTVESTDAELTENLFKSCNMCGLEDNLDVVQKIAITKGI